MNKQRYLIYLILLIPLPGISQELIWEENFNSSSLDDQIWNIETGTGVNGDFGTGQVDRATDRPENIYIDFDVPGAEDGCLVITTRKEYYIDRNYTSGRINTAGKDSWGPGHRIEARVYPRDVRYPGQGFAFWMMPDEIPPGWGHIMWPQGGEIDIMEYVGAIPGHNLGSVHYAWEWTNNEWREWNHGHKGAYFSYERGEVPDPVEPGLGGYPADPTDQGTGNSGFHIYGIDWYYDRMEFYVDHQIYHVHYFNDGGAFNKDGEDEIGILDIAGKRVAYSEYSHHFQEWSPFAHKMFIILSAGVGGSDFSYGGPVQPSSVFPSSTFIDWVKVYKLDVVSDVRNKDLSDFSVTPNPVTDRLFINTNQPENFSWWLTVLSGRELMNGKLNAHGEINLTTVPSGVYIISVSDGQKLYSRKIIVK